MLRLIKLWLKAPIEERDEGNGTWRISGGKCNMRGTLQGGVASRMNRFLKQWRLTGCAEAFHAHVSRMLTTSSSSVADARLRLWRGRRR